MTVGCQGRTFCRVAWRERFGLRLKQLGRHRQLLCLSGVLSVLNLIRIRALFEKGGCTGAGTPVSKFRANNPCGHLLCCSSPAARRLGSGDGNDIWLDDWNIEVMIWLYNHGQAPWLAIRNRGVLFKLSTGKTMACVAGLIRRAAAATTLIFPNFARNKRR